MTTKSGGAWKQLARDPDALDQELALAVEGGRCPAVGGE